ncbi:MAG: hypothetical protein J0H85_01750 [Sediminibacterium magnilacihabitans]|nr:hypothetical protein [Sediminibacterium magnilacihabitans]
MAASRILLQHALRWERSLTLRRYIAELRDRATVGGTTLSDEMTNYLEWAAKKADWYDPFINAIDDLLSTKTRRQLNNLPRKKLPSLDLQTWVIPMQAITIPENHGI